MGSGIAVYNGNAYADGKNGNMYAISEHSNTATWITQIGASSIGNVSSPAIDSTHGVVYVGSLSCHIDERLPAHGFIKQKFLNAQPRVIDQQIGL